MRNILLISLYFFLLTSCGYTPIYNNSSSKNINIEITSIQGDNYLNQKLVNELKKNISNNNDNFKVNIISTFEKKIISKDKKGKTTHFELIANIKFDIKNDKFKEIFSFQENLKIENKSNTFEQRKYEKIIKENFARTIKRKFILKLNSLTNSND